MKAILTNWKTTLIGVVVITIKLLAMHGKISMEDATVIGSGIGLIAAHDGKPADNDK